MNTRHCHWHWPAMGRASWSTRIGMQHVDVWRTFSPACTMRAAILSPLLHAPAAPQKANRSCCLQLKFWAFLSGTAASAPAGRRQVHIPPVVHQTLPADPTRPRTIVVGDVHGCCDELKELLAKCNYSPASDRVVLVGDLVNKGPLSVETVRFARTAGLHAVRGNHDDVALFARERRDRARREAGDLAQTEPKYAWTDGLDEGDLAYLRGLPFTLALEEADGSAPSLVVHAGVVPGLPLAQQSPEFMYTMRNLMKTDPSGPTWEPSASANEGVAWAKEWTPERCPAGEPRWSHVYFGHDAKRGLQLEAHATGLDTGACYGGELTAVLLPERRLVSVAARRMYSEPKGPMSGPRVGDVDVTMKAPGMSG